MILVLIFIGVATLAGFSAWMVIVNLARVVFSALGLVAALIRLAVITAGTELRNLSRRRRAMETKS